MLHSDLGTSETRRLIRKITSKGFIPTTYEDIYNNYYQKNVCPPNNFIVISIDDFGPSLIRVPLYDMVEIFNEVDIPITISLIVNEETPDGTWEYCKRLQRRGGEIASHTISHSDLTDLSNEQILWELETSYQLICEKVGTCPLSLTLPYGKGANDPYILNQAEEIGYKMIISIEGAPTVSLGEFPIVLERMGPSVILND